MILFSYIKNMAGRLLRYQYIFFNKYRFKSVGKRAQIIKPLRIDGADNITLGNNVEVHEGTWLAAMSPTGDEVQLVIKDNATIGHFNHIYSTSSIVIEEDVLTADKVYISDNLHNYEDVNLPVLKQPIKQCAPVVIGEGSWLGENVCVIGASIGKHCVIGANAVVTKDIPDYCVAVGAPARIIKQYNVISCQWEKLI